MRCCHYYGMFAYRIQKLFYVSWVSTTAYIPSNTCENIFQDKRIAYLHAQTYSALTILNRGNYWFLSIEIFEKAKQKIQKYCKSRLSGSVSWESWISPYQISLELFRKCLSFQIHVYLESNHKSSNAAPREEWITSRSLIFLSTYYILFSVKCWKLHISKHLLSSDVNDTLTQDYGRVG